MGLLGTRAGALCSIPTVRNVGVTMKFRNQTLRWAAISLATSALLLGGAQYVSAATAPSPDNPPVSDQFLDENNVEGSAVDVQTDAKGAKFYLYDTGDWVLELPHAASWRRADSVLQRRYMRWHLRWDIQAKQPALLGRSEFLRDHQPHGGLPSLAQDRAEERLRLWNLFPEHCQDRNEF